MTQPHTPHCAPACVRVEAGKTYSWCTCGLSDKQPFCDGRHKTLATEKDGATFFPFRSHKFTAEKDEEVWLCQCKHTSTPPFCDGTHHSLKESTGQD